VWKLEHDGPIFGCALQEIDPQPVGKVFSVLDLRRQSTKRGDAARCEKTREQPLDDRPAMVIRDQVDLVGDDGSRSEARSPYQARKALIGRDDEVRLFGADRLPMIAGRDAEANVGGFDDEIVERVIDLAARNRKGTR
jgi:hypothetical protein